MKKNDTCFSGHTAGDSRTILTDIIRDKAPTFMDGSARSETVLDAFRHIDRTCFLPEKIRHLAIEDESITVGYNQTTSQPSTLAFMFDKLAIEKGDRILEIGTGVGYAAAVVSQLCGRNGTVHTIEMIPELAKMAGENLKDFSNITPIQGDGSSGCMQYAPFNKIFFSAGTGPGFCFEPLLEQLAPDGRLMFPRRFGELFLYSREGDRVRKEIFYTVSFVRLRGENSGW